jgi:hypothetical protein
MLNRHATTARICKKQIKSFVIYLLFADQNNTSKQTKIVPKTDVIRAQTQH